MHERTERAIARLLFVFCCAIPTATVMLFIIATWTPWYHRRQLRAMELELSRDTGLNVQIDDFSRVSPAAWSLENVRLSEPETGQEVLRVERVTWINENDRVGISLHKPVLQSALLGHTWKLAHDRFLCRPELMKIPIELAANDFIIESESRSQHLRNVAAKIVPRPNSVVAELRCIPEGSHTSVIEVSVTRDRGARTPRTHWSLDTGSYPLLCSALAGYVTELKQLGPDATFQGALTWELGRDGDWSIDLGSSQFGNIELSQLFENRPHRFTGTADLILDRCLIVPDQRIDVQGSVQARDGYIGQSLLRSLEKELGFIVDGESLQPTSGDVGYQLVSLDFNMTDWRLRINGTCGWFGDYQLEPGIVAVGPTRLLAKSRGVEMPSISLFKAIIAPEDGERIPVTRQTAGLLEIFIPPSHAVPLVEPFVAPPVDAVQPASHASDEADNVLRSR